MHFVVAVRDSAANAFARPFVVPTPGMAIRSFTDEVNRRDEANSMFKHPDDYVLFELGSFDDESGVITSLPSPRQLCRAKDVFLS